MIVATCNGPQLTHGDTVGLTSAYVVPIIRNRQCPQYIQLGRSRTTSLESCQHDVAAVQNMCKEAQFPEQITVVDNFLTYLSGLDNQGNWVDPYKEIFMRPPPPAPPAPPPPPTPAPPLSGAPSVTPMPCRPPLWTCTGVR